MKPLKKMIKRGRISTFGLARLVASLASKLLGVGGLLLFITGAALGFLLGVESICRRWGIVEKDHAFAFLGKPKNNGEK